MKVIKIFVFRRFQGWTIRSAKKYSRESTHCWSPASSTGLYVVRMGFSSNGRGHTLHLSRPKTTVPINTKFGTNDNVGQTKRIAEFCSNRFYGSSSPCGWNIQLEILGLFLYFFLLLVSSTHLQTTIRNALWRVMAQETGGLIVHLHFATGIYR